MQARHHTTLALLLSEPWRDAVCGARKEQEQYLYTVLHHCIDTAWSHAVDNTKHILKSSRRHKPHFDMFSLMLQRIYGSRSYRNTFVRLGGSEASGSGVQAPLCIGALFLCSCHNGRYFNRLSGGIFFKRKVQLAPVFPHGRTLTDAGIDNSDSIVYHDRRSYRGRTGYPVPKP